ncbi:cyclic-phosphate processing receiver domain-containing protein [Paenibacillus apiarius]|uniref:cyclic-phosphate processing receiver domain-containing protein n=1 Tax=Paenibacillus apiarius TaxID=46240 RepID=UPI0019822DAC|nr:cyclic-phosphate processing receiver domain-containing protein [Paenibacillus apiarius]MBN3527472.1 cell division protein FtsJ [Paenibacillus apiarius]
MIHVYLDDWRRCPDGFVLARNMVECLLLLEHEEVGILSLDHDLGMGEPTGTELVSEIVRRRLYPKQEIYLHTSSAIGRQQMYQMLYENKPEQVALINGPMSPDVMARVKRDKQ